MCEILRTPQTIQYVSDGLAFNINNTVVYVSGNTTNDETDCLFAPEEMACSTLKFALTNIIQRGMFWIETINLDGLSDRTFSNSHHRTRRDAPWNITIDNASFIQLPEFNTRVFHNWNINIVCSKSCVLENDFYIFSRSFQENPVVHMENISVMNSKVTIHNVHMVFRNVHFLNSIVTDLVHMDDPFGQVALQFIKTKFESDVVANENVGLYLNQTIVATVNFLESELVHSKVHIRVSDLLFESTDTLYSESKIVLVIDILCIVRFQHDVISSYSSTDGALLEIRSIMMSLHFTDSSMKNGNGGIVLIKPESGLLDSWMRVRIQNCIFQNNKKLGTGGAVAIYYVAQDFGTSNAGSFLMIIDCAFSMNEVGRLSSTVSQGGAVSIHTPTGGNNCKKLYVNFETIAFLDNKAIDGGGAIWISDGCVETIVSNSTFQVTDQMFDSPKGVFILANSDITIDRSVFTRKVKQLSPSLVELQMLSEMSAIKQLDMVVQCPAWYEVTLNAKFIEEHAKEVVISCTSCPATSYTPSEGHFAVSYLSGVTEQTRELLFTSAQ